MQEVEESRLHEQALACRQRPAKPIPSYHTHTFCWVLCISLAASSNKYLCTQDLVPNKAYTTCSSKVPTTFPQTLSLALNLQLSLIKSTLAKLGQPARLPRRLAARSHRKHSKALPSDVVITLCFLSGGFLQMVSMAVTRQSYIEREHRYSLRPEGQTSEVINQAK